MSEERYSRQRDIVPRDRLLTCKATVVGVGAVGRQVALQLSAMGLPWLQLVDFDFVEESNLASQGYLESDLGRPKVGGHSRHLPADEPRARDTRGQAEVPSQHGDWKRPFLLRGPNRSPRPDLERCPGPGGILL